MREVLNNQQIVCPGDATQFMHAIFSSDHEMMTFYLTLNRFINPASYLVERSDRQRLEDLENVLFGNVAAFEAVHHIDCIIDSTKNSWQYKQMYRVNHLHLENVRYLLNRLNEE